MPPSKNSNPKSKAKKVKASKEPKSEVQESAPVTPEVSAPVDSPPTENAETSETGWESLDLQFKSILTQLSSWKTEISTMQSNVRKLQKNVQRNLKENAKKNRKKKKSNEDKPKRTPSGFAKPALISDDLCDFLEVDKGTEMARTEVTKHLTQYIKAHSLQDQENKRRILVDNKLGKLLGVTQADEVTYFNLQKYMKIHFPKSQAQLLAQAQEQQQSK